MNSSSSPTPTPSSPATLAIPSGTASPTRPLLLQAGENSGNTSPVELARNSRREDTAGITISRRTAIIGLGAAGVGFVVVLMAVLACFCCSKKKRNKKLHNSMRYYADSVPNRDPKPFGVGVAESAFYDDKPLPNWHKGQPPSAPTGAGGWKPHALPPPVNSDVEDLNSDFMPHGAPRPPPAPIINMGLNKATFTYEELSAATGGFAQANLVGQGGFGYVHKGVLSNGKEVAVKQLKSGSRQGEREFQAEVDIISRVHHRHLVSLVGYCISGSHRLLVYEFVANKTLDHHLHVKNQQTMNWPTRMKIAIGAAKGIAYLHEDCQPRIIHRDIKSSNILLDFKFEAKVADFGLAKLSLDDHTHVSTRVMGTFGYLAPEYASSGKLTEKSDVFSFGVMLLEIITGRRPSERGQSFMDDSLVDWAKPIMSRAIVDGNYGDLVDSRLENNYNAIEMASMISCCAACVRHSAKRRPRMSQIVRALEGDLSLEDLNDGVRPGQSILFSSGSDYDSSSYTSSMSRFRRAALNSPEYSAEYSGPIAEFDHRPSASSSEGDFSGEVVGPARNKKHLRGHP